jgi:nitrate reductase (cytochrome), electron transfer subunit
MSRPAALAAALGIAALSAVAVFGVLRADGLAGRDAADTPPSTPAEPPPAAIADRDLGLSKTSVFEVPSPPPVADNDSAPGEEPVLPRAYPGAPPRIPHGIAALLPITRQDNFCIDCHLTDEKVEGGPTPIPASHKTDLRNAPGKAGERVVGARWFCVSCHVPVTGAAPLVGNSFSPRPSPPPPSPPATAAP